MEVGHAQSLYQPLNTNRHEIRLLEILSESPNDKVECKLHTVPLTPETYYVCLSYVWGDPSVTEEITVDGFPRQVTVNLATALRHLKKHWMEIELESDSNLDTSKFRLWADAVCINQDDIAERSAQVSMMANIYSSAEMVLAWISSDDGDISRAFDIFERIGAAVREDWDAESDHTPLPLTDLKFEIRAMKVPKDNPRFSWLFPEKSVLFDRESNHFRSYEPHYYIVRFIRLSFWYRAWIQQELVLAKRLFYLSPSHKLSHLKCSVAFYALKCYLRHLGNMDSRLQGPLEQETARYLLAEYHNLLTLFEAIRWARLEAKISEEWTGKHLHLSFQREVIASNKLDHVYGLLAVTKLPIIPDYTKSIREVYTEFVQAFVTTWKRLQKNSRFSEELRGLGCLHFLKSHAIGTRRLHELPSWAPVFTADEQPMRLANETWFRPPRNVYQTVPELWNHVPVDISGTSLWAKAIKTQTIIECYQEPVSEDFMCNRLACCVNDLLQVHGETYINGKSFLEVLCCTFLLNADGRYNTQRLSYWLLVTKQVHGPIQMSQQPHHDSITGEWLIAGRHQKGSRLFTTEDGYIGLAAGDVLPSDVVCVLAGCRLLVILRPENDHYLFVGCCFMLGLMDGEVADLLASGRTEVQLIEIK